MMMPGLEDLIACSLWLITVVLVTGLLRLFKIYDLLKRDFDIRYPETKTFVLKVRFGSPEELHRRAKSGIREPLPGITPEDVNDEKTGNFNPVDDFEAERDC